MERTPPTPQSPLNRTPSLRSACSGKIPACCPGSFSSWGSRSRAVLDNSASSPQSEIWRRGQGASHAGDPCSVSVWTWHFSKPRCTAAKCVPPFFSRLTSSFTRGNDLPLCRMTFTCWAPVLLRFRRKEKKKTKRCCCWTRQAAETPPVVSKG